jgi:carboxyl-terminal processing protease
LKKLVLFLFLAASAYLSLYWWSYHDKAHPAVLEICNLVTTNHFKQNSELERWGIKCHRFAKAIGKSMQTNTDYKLVAQKTNDLLSELKSSHLSVFTPEEDKEIWQGEYQSHGVQFLKIKDRFFVERVLAGSVAARLGVKFGDELLEINSQSNLSNLDLINSEGWFKFNRSGKELLLNLSKSEVKLDKRPVLFEQPNYRILKVPSFKKENFERRDLELLARKLKKNDKPIFIDLRFNQGGSFVAMLRLLSLFLCNSEPVGTLITSNSNHSKDIQDDMRDEILIQDVKQLSVVYLKAFPGYACVKSPLRILVNSQTMSVAEIFADAVNSKSKIIGNKTSGRVVVGVWYTLSQWPEGFTVSIPQANYKTPDGQELESIGVKADVNVEYTVKDLQAGKDPWIIEALNTL